jgi:hypothetical protein
MFVHKLYNQDYWAKVTEARKKEADALNPSTMTPPSATQLAGYSSFDARELYNGDKDTTGGDKDTTGGDKDTTNDGPKVGEIRVIDGVSYSWDGKTWVRLDTGDGGGGGGTFDLSIYKPGETVTINNKNYVFDGKTLVPIGTGGDNLNVGGNAGTTETPTTAIPNVVPGSDANVNTQKYIESLGTNTLAGQAYSEALARRLASIQNQQFAAGQSYQDMYDQARMSQAARRGMSDVSGMTGGMAEGMQAQLSAAEMRGLGQIGISREQTMRDLELARMGAPMEAFGEARAIDEYEMAKEELERSRMMQDVEMQQAETLFEQAQSGWVQNEDGTWTNIDKETQDALSLQAINAQQRAEVLGEMQYWQGVLADPTQVALHADAQKNLGTLQTRYADLLLNNSVMTGGPSSTTPTPEPEPEPEPEPTNDAWEIDFTKGTVEQNAQDYVANIGANLITEETDLSGFRTDIRTSEDLAEGIVKLAGDKDIEGYDFKPEIELVNRALYNRESITQDEFLNLADAGLVRFQGNEDFKFLEFAIGTEDLSSSIRYPKTPLMETFFRKMVADGILTENQVAQSVGDKGYTFPKSDISFANGQSGKLDNELINWLNAGKPTTSANINNTGFAAGSSDWLATLTGR